MRENKKYDLTENRNESNILAKKSYEFLICIDPWVNLKTIR